MFKHIRYYLPEEAKEELDKRRENKELISKIEKDLGENFLSFFSEKPISIMWRSLIVPNNTLFSFVSLSQQIKIKPVALEYLGDKFTSVNEDKKKLCKLKLKVKNQYRNIKICNIEKNENKKISDVFLKNGTNLIHFYTDLINKTDLSFVKIDITEWAQKNYDAKIYYYFFLLHFLAHGILFENFFITSNDEYENQFTKECILPVMERIKTKYNLDPIIIKIFPEAKSKKDEIYWWSFPENINNYLLKYFEKEF